MSAAKIKGNRRQRRAAGCLFTPSGLHALTQKKPLVSSSLAQPHRRRSFSLKLPSSIAANDDDAYSGALPAAPSLFRLVLPISGPAALVASVLHSSLDSCRAHSSMVQHTDSSCMPRMVHISSYLQKKNLRERDFKKFNFQMKRLISLTTACKCCKWPSKHGCTTQVPYTHAI